MFVGSINIITAQPVEINLNDPQPVNLLMVPYTVEISLNEVKPHEFNLFMFGVTREEVLQLIEENAGSGGGGTGIIIPKLNIKSTNTKPKNGQFFIRDTLLAMWESAETKFLDYNPEIWIYKYNNYRKLQTRLPLANETELLVGGNFENPFDWNILSGVVNDGAYTIADAPAGMVLESLNSIGVTAVCRVRMTVSNYVSGEVECTVSGSRVYGLTSINCNGAYTGYVEINTQEGAFLQLRSASEANATMTIDNISVMECTGSFYRKIVKKWKHEAHLNGIKYPGGKYYAGKTYLPGWGGSLIPDGRHTEFALTGTSGQWTDFGFPVWDYVFGKPLNINEDVLLLSDEFDFSTLESFEMRPNRKRMRIRLAIVIDNPDEQSDNPKMEGPKSDIIEMRLDHNVNAYSGYDAWRVTFSQHNLWIRT